MLSSEFCNSDDFLELNLWTFDMDLRTNHDTYLCDSREALILL